MAKPRTSAQEQYYLLKQAHQDCLLFFRLGDFYELFYEDAHTAHKVLGITLTAKNKKSSNPIPMAGVPFHAADKYIPQLIDAGYKVAIAEQVGEVVPGKVVDRKVVRIVTPGTFEGERRDAVVTAAVRGSDEGGVHCAWGDFTTGRYKTKTVDSVDACALLLESLGATETVIALDFGGREALIKAVDDSSLTTLRSYHDYPTDVQAYIALMTGTTNSDGYGSAVSDGREVALATLFSYLESTQKQKLQGVHTITHDRSSDTIRLDPITIKNLEIVESSYEGSKKHALLGVLDHTKTAMGSRLLKEKITQPLGTIQAIHAMQKNIVLWQEFAVPQQKATLTFLDDCLDIPRLLTRIVYKDPDPLVIASLRDTLAMIVESDLVSDSLVRFGYLCMDDVESLYEDLNEKLHDSALIQQKNAIRDGFDREVDRLRHIVKHGDSAIVDYFGSLKAIVHASTFKIKHISNQGYLLEVSKKDMQAVESVANPDDEKLAFTRCQSLKSAERYTTPHLQQLQEEYFSAKELLQEREAEILCQIKERIVLASASIQACADCVALIDCVVLMDELIAKKGRTVPDVEGGGSYAIVGGRHPVVEHFLEKNKEFIPNDCLLDDGAFFQLITGPNMGGKSTYLRQNALIVLLAHCGFPVPAESARVPLVDGIFARVGSGDALAKNQSTFMTEMVEMAVIVNNATSRSFIILDELGRGTSTYDGLSLAKALCVYICQQVQAKTLFATHYHELIALESSLTGFHNCSVNVYESGDDVIFLKKIVAGGADKSYGLDVAKIAGIPQSIIAQADKYLVELVEGGKSEVIYQQTGFVFEEKSDKNASTIETLKDLLPDSVDEVTPLESLRLLQEILELLRSKK